jgi:hypothetical protein
VTEKAYDGSGLFTPGEAVTPADLAELLARPERLIVREGRVLMGPRLCAAWRAAGWIDEHGRLTILEPETIK